MPHTPSQRTTRSNSNAQNFTLQDIKTLVENAKTEILHAVETKIGKLNDKFESLMKHVEYLSDKQTQLELKCQSLEEKVGQEITHQEKMNKNKEEEIVREIEFRHGRREFLVLSGVPECKTGTLSERQEHDTDAVRQVIEAVGVANFVPKEIMRVGKPDPKRHRLLRIRCDSIDQKFTILRHSKKLHHSQFRHVFINQDLTKSQRERHKLLREQLKHRRLKGEMVRIRHGVIVNSQPNENFH